MNRNSLSVGDVVSAGLRIYRDRFGSYFSLAFFASLWSLVPIYGWAKCWTIAGLISRLAFSEVIEKPETVTEARRYTDPRLWKFFNAGLLVGLILIGAIFCAVLVFALSGFLLSPILGTPEEGSILLGLLFLVEAIAFIVIYIWLYSRLSLVELPIAVEENINSSTAISRSWNLTKQFVGRLQLIFFIAVLISLPFSIIVNILSIIIQAVVQMLVGRDSPLFSSIVFLLSLPLNILFNALIMPFWQSIKAVIYYDLRSRREGIDLEV